MHILLDSYLEKRDAKGSKMSDGSFALPLETRLVALSKAEGGSCGIANDIANGNVYYESLGFHYRLDSTRLNKHELMKA